MTVEEVIESIKNAINIAGYIVFVSDRKVEPGLTFEGIEVNGVRIMQPFTIVCETTREDAVANWTLAKSGEVPVGPNVYYYRAYTD